ncbi:hypothetical protein JCM9492_08890 [Aquifex pyrophilus]
MRRLIILFFLLVSFSFPLSPEEEKQLLRDIAEIKATLRAFMRETDKRFEQVDKRFEQVDRRISALREDMNNRFELMNKRFDQLYTFLWIITGIFTTLTASVIAFAWWDRKTIIRKAKEETFEEMERELRPEKLKQLINTLREKAKTDKELEAILKKYGLL